MDRLTPLSSNILLVSEDEENLTQLAGLVRESAAGTLVLHRASDADTALELLEQQAPDLIITPLRLPGCADWSARLMARARFCPVLMLGEAGDESRVIELLRLGVSDFFPWPLQGEEEGRAFGQSVWRLLRRGQLVTESRRYREELEESLALLREDQQAGNHVQQKMLPPRELVINGYRFHHHIKPSLFLSGDFIDYFRISESLSMFYLADISGHGASSAFVTVLLKNLTNRLLRNYNRGSSFQILSPTDVLSRINKELLETGLGKHLTIFVGLLDRIENTLQYGVGGHYPMPILTQGGVSHFLKGRGMPVGLFEDAEYDGRIVELEDEFTLTLFSDGIIEILPQASLAEKEAFLLEKTALGYTKMGELARALGVEDVQEAPDDIGVLSVSRVS